MNSLVIKDRIAEHEVFREQEKRISAPFWTEMKRKERLTVQSVSANQRIDN
jgi:hypothetical protein